MSAVLRKQIHRRDEDVHNQFLAAVLPATVIVLILATLLAILGHFFPAG